MLAQEIIRRKRTGQPLAEAEIGVVVRGITDGSWSEGQIAAFAMAVCCLGMNRAECVALTRAMTRSGRSIDWQDLALPGPIVDKHSTGGVGDKVSLMLAPIVAACGGFVPMISGRGLGHTGGTLDKLAAIPGYRVDPDTALFRRTVREVGCAIVGQTDDLAPADRRFYAIRDITGTVESTPLITASILSKKLAAGLQGLVMDVKTGSGAFAAEPAAARELAESLVAVASGAGLGVVALITDMDQVLGHSVGNSVEVDETLRYLADASTRDVRLHEVVMALAAEMLVIGHLADTLAAARAKAEAALADGRARERFGRMVAALGGPKDFAERPHAYLPRAKVERPCPALQDGSVIGMDARMIGLAVIGLGGGRKQANDRIDPSVGLTRVCGVGQTIRVGEPMAMVHAVSEADADAAISALQASIRIGDCAPPPRPVVHARLGTPQ
jgi:thymidine phosphorylase